MINVLVADDHTIVRRGIIQIINETANMQVIDEVGDGKSAYKRALQNDIDVLILDVSMPEITGYDVLGLLSKERPNLPVIILSIYPAKYYAIRFLQAGAMSYLSKESAPDELIDAIESVYSGKAYLTEEVSLLLLSQAQNKKVDKLAHELLSQREFEVMKMIAQGMRSGEIAQKLSLSPKTISTYRTRILEKLNFSSTADVIRYTLEHKLI